MRRERREEQRTRNVHRKNRGGLSPSMAAVGLVATVLVVSVAGFVAISAMETDTSTTTQKSCAPATSPQCKAEGNLTESMVSEFHVAGFG